MNSARQWIRKVGLIVWRGDEKSGGDGIDLSQMRIRFRVEQQDNEHPNSAAIRIYNLKQATIEVVRHEYSRVSLSAGYQEAESGIIFTGTIRQFGWGRESETDTYLDVFASDSDLPYNWSFLNKTVAKGSTIAQLYQSIADDMGLELELHNLPATGGILPRGRVKWAFGKVPLGSLSRTVGATWSIQNGKLVVKPLDGYLPGDPLEINMQSGMIGIPEQTIDGVRVRTLLNPRLSIGTRVRLNNKDVAQAAYTAASHNIPYNTYAGTPEFLATVGAADGEYMLFVVDHTGDTRGPEWYSDLTLLAIDPSSQKVIAN
jgi:hypothetical protein